MKQQNIKKTIVEFKKDVFNLVNTEYEVLGEYENNSTKILIKHTTCSHIYSVTPGNFLNGKRCPNCFKRNKLNFEKELEIIRPGEFTLLSIYKNKKTNIKVKHNKTGYIWDVSPRDILNNKECPVYAKNVNNMNTDLFKIKVKQIHPYFKVLGEYENRKTAILMENTKYNFKFSARPTSIMKKTFTGRRNMIQENKQIDFEKFANTLDSDYAVIGTYKNSKEKIEFQHLSCNRIFSMRPNDFQQGSRCPYCANDGKSKIEKELKDYIKSIYFEDIIENYSDKKEIDIYLPKLNIGIEFDGLYWHSSIQKEKKYHINKTIYFKKKGIRIIHIFEDEWLYKNDIVKDKIKHILKLSNTSRIYARKCEVKEITTSVKTEFLNKYHIQGTDRSNIKLGLFYNNNLISVMTFGKNRVALGGKSNKTNYELIRFASTSAYIVLGSFGKLLKYFKRNYEWNTITTYADYRWSDENNIYETFKFKKVRLSEPNYWYFYNSNKIRYHRYSYRKQILKNKFPAVYDVNKTEKEIVALGGMLCIYDCGNLVYELKNEK